MARFEACWRARFPEVRLPHQDSTVCMIAKGIIGLSTTSCPIVLSEAATASSKACLA